MIDPDFMFDTFDLDEFAIAETHYVSDLVEDYTGPVSWAGYFGTSRDNSGALVALVLLRRTR